MADAVPVLTHSHGGWLPEVTEPVIALIWYCTAALIGVYGAEGVVLGCNVLRVEIVRACSSVRIVRYYSTSPSQGSQDVSAALLQL